MGEAESQQNHYQVLKIERTADERTIKKAYFGLIREFPPDKHPEEFKRLREAYETLSDAAARARYDAADKDYLEYGADVAARLREIDRLAKEGTDAEVLSGFRDLVRDEPELAVAREGLAHAHMRAGEFDKALEQWEALCDKVPTDARYHLFRGVSAHRLEKPKKAEKAIRKARQLEPKTLRFLLALVDLLSALKRHHEAIDEIDAALPEHDAEFEAILALSLRKVDTLCTMGKSAEANEVLDKLFLRMAEQAEPELAKYVSSQLAGIAAKMFARNQFDDANGLLERCHEIHPTSIVHHPFPPRAVIDVRALPQTAQKWLGLLEPGPSSATIVEAIWTKPVLALLGSLGLSVGTWFLLFGAPEAWNAGRWLLAFVSIGASVMALSFSVRMIVKILQSPLRAFVTIHPLYLLRARGTRLEVYPLFNLADVKAVHHHTNGVYTHTQATLRFAEKAVNIAIRGQEYAQGWLQHLVECRARSLELMGEGFLEAEQGVDLVPPALLTDPDAAPLSRWGRSVPESRELAKAPVAKSWTRKDHPAAAMRREMVRWYGAAGGIAVVLTGAAGWQGSRLTDDRAFAAALARDTDEGLSRYLSEFPSGRHVEAARRLHGARLRDAEALLGTAKARGAKPLLDAISALARSGDKTLPISFQVDAEGLPAAASKAFSRPAMSPSVERVLFLLNVARGAAGLAPLVKFERGSDDSAARPASLIVRGVAKPDDSYLKAVGGTGAGAVASIPSVVIEWHVKIVVHGEGARDHELSFSTRAPARLRVTKWGDLAGAGYERMAQALVDSFAERLAAELGLGPAAAAARELPSDSIVGVIGGLAP